MGNQLLKAFTLFQRAYFRTAFVANFFRSLLVTAFLFFSLGIFCSMIAGKKRCKKQKKGKEQDVGNSVEDHGKKKKKKVRKNGTQSEWLAQVTSRQSHHFLP